MNIIVINGFLGSGKTTTLKNLINQLQSEKVALIINEFGNSSFDSNVLSEFKVKIEEIKNGSIFCSCKSDEFVMKFQELLNKNLDFVLIESSGFSNPVSLDKMINFSLKSINTSNLEVFYVTIVDPIMFPKLSVTLNSYKNQIDMADVIILNKQDTVEKNELEVIKRSIIELNSKAKLIETTYGEVKFNHLLVSKSDRTFNQQIHKKSLTDSSISFLMPKSTQKADLEKLLLSLSQKVYRMKGNCMIENQAYTFEIASQRIVMGKTRLINFEATVLFSSNDISSKKVKEILIRHLGEIEIYGVK